MWTWDGKPLKKSQLSIFVSPASMDWLMAKNISNDHERLPKNYWIISSKTISTACFQETDNNDISNHADWRWELDTEKQGLKDIKYGPSHVSQSYLPCIVDLSDANLVLCAVPCILFCTSGEPPVDIWFTFGRDPPYLRQKYHNNVVDFPISMTVTIIFRIWT